METIHFMIWFFLQSTPWILGLLMAFCLNVYFNYLVLMLFFLSWALMQTFLKLWYLFYLCLTINLISSKKVCIQCSICLLIILTRLVTVLLRYIMTRLWQGEWTIIHFEIFRIKEHRKDIRLHNRIQVVLISSLITKVTVLILKRQKA